MTTTRTFIDTTARLCPGDHIQNPDGKWMLVADITYATADGPLGAHAVLLINPAVGAHGARLMILGSGHMLDIRRDLTRNPQPHLGEHTKVRRRGIGFEVWDTRCLEWVYIVPGVWRDEFGGALEADEATLARLSDNGAVGRIVVTFSNAISDRTPPHRRTFNTLDEACTFAAGYWPFNNTRVDAHRVLATGGVERVNLRKGKEIR